MGTKADYSGFDRSNWTPRTSTEHIKFATMGKRAPTKAARKRIEDEYGARWSEFFRLPYYDAVRMVVIDPMHNILLGTSKHVFAVWKYLGILSKKDFETLQNRIDNVKVPQDLGRIPSNITSGFSGFTADQWKNWTTVYSLFCLKGLIGEDHYDMWYDFVQACSILCSRIISVEKVKKADDYLMTFLHKFERLYGPQHCTPNMHLHLHLKECIFDYGPVYSFWCFSFERYNGMLGSYQHNNRNIEVQIMRRFQQSQQLGNLPWPSHYGPSFKAILQPKSTENMFNFQDLLQQPSDRLCFDDASKVDPLLPFRNIVLSTNLRDSFLNLYKKMYPDTSISHVSMYAMTCTRVKHNGVVYSVDGCRTERSACVYAKWCSNPSLDEPIVDLQANPRPGLLKKLYILNLTTKQGTKHKHVVAEVAWCKLHPERWFYRSPIQVCCLDYEIESVASFLPVELIGGRHFNC